MNENCEKCPYIQNLKEDVQGHQKILDRHEDDISDLKADGREYKTDIKNLCKQVSDLISTIKWGLGISVTITLFVLGVLIKKG